MRDSGCLDVRASCTEIKGLLSSFGGQIGLVTLLGSYFIVMILVSQYLLK